MTEPKKSWFSTEVNITYVLSLVITVGGMFLVRDRDIETLKTKNEQTPQLIAMRNRAEDKAAECVRREIDLIRSCSCFGK